MLSVAAGDGSGDGDRRLHQKCVSRSPSGIVVPLARANLHRFSKLETTVGNDYTHSATSARRPMGPQVGIPTERQAVLRRVVTGMSPTRSASSRITLPAQLADDVAARDPTSYHRRKPAGGKMHLAVAATKSLQSLKDRSAPTQWLPRRPGPAECTARGSAELTSTRRDHHRAADDEPLGVFTA